MQQGQVFELKKLAVDGSPIWRTGTGPTVRVLTAPRSGNHRRPTDEKASDGR